MRCKACNAELSDFEATLKSVESGEYFDLCYTCYRSISDVCPAIERFDLAKTEDLETENQRYDLEED